MDSHDSKGSLTPASPASEAGGERCRNCDQPTVVAQSGYTECLACGLHTARPAPAPDDAAELPALSFIRSMRPYITGGAGVAFHNACDAVAVALAAAGRAEHVVVLTRDGDQWCALLGENLQEGYAGFDVTPAGALHALADEWYRADNPDAVPCLTADGRPNLVMRQYAAPVLAAARAREGRGEG